MARVAVIGGGFGSLAAAARLAKQGHEVSLFEAAETLGGAVGLVAADGFTWDAGPTHTLLPAVIRDLFRKSGLPAEREFELVPRAPIREHRWPDGSALGLPGGSRSAQMAAFDALSPGAGDPWAAYVDAAGRDWDLLRRVHFEAAPDPAQVPADAARRLRTRRTLAARLRPPSPTSGCATSRRTRSSRAARIPGGCRSGSVSPPTWSSGSAPGGSPEAWERWQTR